MRRAILIALLMTAGCESTTPTENPVGEFYLASMNGQDLPATAADGVTVRGGSMLIREDETYTQSWTLSFGSGSHDGTYRIDEEGVIRFQMDDPPQGVSLVSFSGTFDGEKLTIESAGSVFIYRP